MSEQLEFDLADRLRRALRVSGTSSQAMADFLGVSRTSVSAWINGRVVPDQRTVMLWAQRTEFPREWLETGETPSPGGPGEGVSSLRARRYSKPQPSDPNVRGWHPSGKAA